MSTYTTIQGDVWDAIASKVYGDSKYMGFLMDANPDKITIFVFGAGVVLIIPDLPESETAAPNMPTWRTG